MLAFTRSPRMFPYIGSCNQRCVSRWVPRALVAVSAVAIAVVAVPAVARALVAVSAVAIALVAIPAVAMAVVAVLRIAVPP